MHSQPLCALRFMDMSRGGVYARMARPSYMGKGPPTLSRNGLCPRMPQLALGSSRALGAPPKTSLNPEDVAHLLGKSPRDGHSRTHDEEAPYALSAGVVSLRMHIVVGMCLGAGPIRVFTMRSTGNWRFATVHAA